MSRIAGAGSYRLTTAFTQTASRRSPRLPRRRGHGDSVAVGDLNGDGYPGHRHGNRIDDTVSVFLGIGDGTFQLPETYAVGARVWQVTVADVTGNGRLDILTANKGANTISLLLNNGDGTFQPQIVIPTGTRPSGVTVADLNGDGIPDLVVDNYAADTISVLSGRRQRHASQPPDDLPHRPGPGLRRPGCRWPWPT